MQESGDTASGGEATLYKGFNIYQKKLVAIRKVHKD